MFGQKLQRLREERGLGLRETAERCGIAAGYLSKIERNLAPPPQEAVLKALAEVLDLNPHVLMAMAGRVTQAFLDALQRYPEEFAELVQRLERASQETVVKATQTVRDGEW